jgi:hypothetical protein
MNIRPAAISLCLGTLALLAGSPALAQIYKCVGTDGKTVYSQSPCAKNAKSVPMHDASAPPPAPAPAAAAPATASGAPALVDMNGKPIPAAAPAGPKSTAEQEADFKKRHLAEAEAAKKAADKSAQDAVKQQNCAAAKSNLTSLATGRQARYDAKGEKYFLNDDQIAAEAERNKQSISANCS